MGERSWCALLCTNKQPIAYRTRGSQRSLALRLFGRDGGQRALHEWIGGSVLV